ncbi:hypothetical protein EJ913_11815 [Azospirillum doebereinerae]|uniref:Uncharacterized protein n=1 Tax=Azospirillum doebereinerae TaxID=92933 RepID=A0A3S0WZA5_9PROT|nr:hypothetical protein EJ913_11815 [Azospirillum doebereinerae]
MIKGTPYKAPLPSWERGWGEGAQIVPPLAEYPSSQPFSHRGRRAFVTPPPPSLCHSQPPPPPAS